MSDVYLGGLTTAGGAHPGDLLEFQNPGSTIGLQRPLSYLDWNVRWIYPQHLVKLGDGLITESVSNSVARAVYGQSGTPDGFAILDVSAWGAGTIDYVLYWSGSTGSTATVVSWGLHVNGLASGVASDLSVDSTILTKNQSVNHNGPAVAETMLKSTNFSASTMTSNVSLLSVNLRRNFSDNYGGDAYLYAIQVVYSS